MYEHLKHLATVSLTDIFDSRDATYHEAFHSLERVLSRNEEKVLQAAFPPEDGMTTSERCAVAFARWATARDGQARESLLATWSGDQPPARRAMRRAMRKMAVLRERAKRAFENKGITTPEDIFEKIYSGEMGKAAVALEKRAAEGRSADRGPPPSHALGRAQPSGISEFGTSEIENPTFGSGTPIQWTDLPEIDGAVGYEPMTSGMVEVLPAREVPGCYRLRAYDGLANRMEEEPKTYPDAASAREATEQLMRGRFSVGAKPTGVLTDPPVALKADVANPNAYWLVAKPVAERLVVAERLAQIADGEGRPDRPFRKAAGRGVEIAGPGMEDATGRKVPRGKWTVVFKNDPGYPTSAPADSKRTRMEFPITGLGRRVREHEVAAAERSVDTLSFRERKARAERLAKSFLVANLDSVDPGAAPEKMVSEGGADGTPFVSVNGRHAERHGKVRKGYVGVTFPGVAASAGGRHASESFDFRISNLRREITLDELAAHVLASPQKEKSDAPRDGENAPAVTGLPERDHLPGIQIKALQTAVDETLAGTHAYHFAKHVRAWVAARRKAGEDGQDVRYFDLARGIYRLSALPAGGTRIERLQTTKTEAGFEITLQDDFDDPHYIFTPTLQAAYALLCYKESLQNQASNEEPPSAEAVAAFLESRDCKVEADGRENLRVTTADGAATYELVRNEKGYDLAAPPVGGEIDPVPPSIEVVIGRPLDYQERRSRAWRAAIIRARRSKTADEDGVIDGVLLKTGEGGAVSATLSFGEPMVFDGTELKRHVSGLPPVETVFMPDGKQLDVTYEIVDARDLTASHDEHGVANPDYPAGLQPRDRTRTASGLQISQMVANLRPEWLGPSAKVTDGAPIIAAQEASGKEPENTVESGNGRTAAILRAYRDAARPKKLSSLDEMRARLESILFRYTHIQNF